MYPFLPCETLSEHIYNSLPYPCLLQSSLPWHCIYKSSIKTRGADVLDVIMWGCIFDHLGPRMQHPLSLKAWKLTTVAPELLLVVVLLSSSNNMNYSQFEVQPEGCCIFKTF